MKTNAIRLTVALACIPLILLGCSKSKNPEPAANNNNSSANSSANGGSTATGPVTLKLKWQAGKEYDMEMALNQSTEINVPGRPYLQELKLTQGLHYSPLKDLGTGGQQVQLEFSRQSLDLTQNGKEVLSYDSMQGTPVKSDSPVAPVAAAMHAMLGVPLNYTFAADGSVEKIDGIDSLASRVTAALPDERQRASLQQLFDENTLKQYGSFSQSLPDHPVNIGDSWSSSHDIQNPAGLMTVSTTLTFKNWEQHNGHNCVHLLVNGDIKTKTASASMVGAIVKIKKGNITGDVWFDPDLGMLVDDNTFQDLTMDITTRSMALTEHMKQNIDLSLLSVNP